MIGLGGFIPDDEVLEELSERINLEVDSSFDEDSEDKRSLYQWNIYYRFADGVRNNKPRGKAYGSEGVTFQTLFKLLIWHNSDINFIDNYIKTVLPYTDIGEEMQEWLSSVEDSVLYAYSSLHKRKDGGLDRRYGRDIRAYADLTKGLEEEQDRNGVTLAREIKDDIAGRLGSGVLPLDPQVNLISTELRRMRADLPATPRFFASGQFINALIITCKFEKRRSSWSRDTMA